MLLHYFLEFNVLALPSNYFLQMRKATAPLEKQQLRTGASKPAFFVCSF